MRPGNEAIEHFLVHASWFHNLTGCELKPGQNEAWE